MVSFVRSPVARVSLLAAALLMCAVESSAEAQQSLRHLDNEAEGAFRRLQAMDDDTDAYMDTSEEPTMSPSSAPTMMESVAPTMMESLAPTTIETMAPTEASGASSWRPSSAGVAALSLVVGVVSAFAMA